MFIKKSSIDKGKEFDWGNTSKDYAKFRDIYPPDFYQKIVDLGYCTKGQQVLDLGTGTGVLPRNMYHFGASFTGTDISENQIIEAKRLASENSMDINFFSAPAEKTNLPDKSFDVITACQCFMYFDKEVVLPEISRLLKDDGHFLILFMAALPLENEIVRKSEEIVKKYNPYWTGGDFARYEVKEPAWSKNLFDCVHHIGYDTSVTFTPEAWHGRMIACRGVGASSLDPKIIESFKIEHNAFVNTLPKTFKIPHFVTLIDLKKK